MAESSLNVKTASSGFSALTTGGALMIALWRPGTSHLTIETTLRTFGESFLPPFRKSLTGGRPHAKTKTERRIQGIHAMRARFGVWTGRFAASAAAIHLTKEDVAEIFSKEVGERLATDIPRLVKVAKKELHPAFLEADMGISGANIAVAETGTTSR